MKFVIKCLIVAGVLGSPCIYDVTSREPSPAAGVIALGGPLLAAGDAHPYIQGMWTSDTAVHPKKLEVNS
ncbi:hypothetical protein GF108_18450 [Phyllobacterium sp. SYP-B3895]|uniref:hypothetical protein n=1 Tax=unclassified Phyllobacterium TaxID=2638441 RepID=UPI00056D3116|nr:MULTISPECIES: hypothetical protein [unclassified Phyllobacterium]MRG57554.1 hypothetical protein [Phyllobacterium sp. SYP-B3895]